MEQLVQNATKFIKEIFQNDFSGHDFFHSMRVYRTAINIAEAEHADIQVVALAALLWIFAPQLVEIFRSDPAVVAVGVSALHIQCCTVVFNGFNMMGNMMTQTMGRTGIASFLALCRQGLFLAPIVLILPMMFGVLGVEMAQSVSDVLTFAVTIPFMRRILRELS